MAAVENAEELLNVYDEAGRVVGAKPRTAAKASGLAVGAVNVLILNARQTRQKASAPISRRAAFHLCACNRMVSRPVPAV